PRRGGPAARGGRGDEDGEYPARREGGDGEGDQGPAGGQPRGRRGDPRIRIVGCPRATARSHSTAPAQRTSSPAVEPPMIRTSFPVRSAAASLAAAIFAFAAPAAAQEDGRGHIVTIGAGAQVYPAR